MTLTTPDVRYAAARDGVHIAYASIGAGDITFVLVPALISQLEVAFEEATFAAFVERLAAGARAVVFDRRGTGLSDRVAGERPTTESLCGDISAVLDDIDARDAVLVGLSMGAMTAIEYAAACPLRTRALIVVGGLARWRRAPDHRFGTPTEQVAAAVASTAERWGDGSAVLASAPSRAGDAEFARWAARLERHSCPPDTVGQSFELFARADVRSQLLQVAVPTLVLHRGGDRVIDVRHGRHLAERIDGARYVELPGDDHFAFVGEQETLFGEMHDFMRECVGVTLRMPSTDPAGESSQLDSREHDVVALVAAGLTNAAIARRLHISPHTVDGRLRRAFAKFGVRSRAELAARYAGNRYPRDPAPGPAAD